MAKVHKRPVGSVTGYYHLKISLPFFGCLLKKRYFCPRMSEKTNKYIEVEARFRKYLLANDLRQNKERYAILKTIYNMEGTFTVDDLLNLMEVQRFPVSRSAIYTTTQLLVQANLIIRHPFYSSTAVFERIEDSSPRSYQICSHCHRITHIKGRDLAEAVGVYHPRRFNVTHRVVYIYGTCPKCELAMNKRLKQLSLK